MGTYTMKISLVFVLWIYGNTVTDGLSDDNIHITGPESFITDGSRNLTLTCLATDADNVTGYSWVPFSCIDYITNSGTCTVIPRLDQDNTTIFCTAVSSQGQTSQARYTFNLKYPPSAAPVITSSRPGEILKDGDTVTCTVTGGKPPVADVTLSCTNPNITNKDTSISTDGSASSSVTVNIAGATEDVMVCRCNATWEPEPGLYTLNINATFLTECAPRLKAGDTNSKENPPTLNSSGISFNVTAYPVPDNFRYMFLGKEGDKQEDVPQRRFKMRAEQVGDSSEVTCTLTPIDVPKEYLGKYRVNVSNRLGGALYYFRVDEAVIPPVPPGPLLWVFIVLVIPAAVLIVGCFIFTIEAKGRQQVRAMPWWSSVVPAGVAALLVLITVIVAAVSEGDLPVVAFALLIPAAVIQIISLGIVVAGAKERNEVDAVHWLIYVVVSLAVAAVLTAVVVVLVFREEISMQPISFGICVGVVIGLDAVVAVLLIVTVFMCRPKSKTGSETAGGKIDEPTDKGRSNPAYQRNDHQPNLYESGSDPGYASTNEITTNPLKGQGSTTAPPSDRDQFGYSCPRDQIPAGDSQSRKASGAPVYAEAGVVNASVAIRDGGNRQPGPPLSTISIAPNGDVYHIVGKRAMGDNTAGGKKIDDG